ncbi:MAG: rhodanese-like domain-containing protein [Pseudobdellovibrionaceae bacterium]
MSESSLNQQKNLKYYVTAFYHFFVLKDLDQQKLKLQSMAEQHKVFGLMILGAEGINATVCAEDLGALSQFKIDLHNWICEETNLDENAPLEIFFKDSTSEVKPFRRLSIKVRDEIVTLGNPALTPIGMKENHHLSPQEWNEVLKKEKDFVLIDTLNWYETQIVTFKGSLIPDIDQFTDFPAYLEQNNIDKEKKMLIFCTGGIRCEKGILELQEKGYQNVYQLNGGILNYIKEFPDDEFQGECFVFDHRVALDQNLNPTQKYGLCPHCGQPGSEKIQCLRCDSESYVCQECLNINQSKHTCSKNCAHQFELHPGRKGPKQQRTF